MGFGDHDDAVCCVVGAVGVAGRAPEILQLQDITINPKVDSEDVDVGASNSR